MSTTVPAAAPAKTPRTTVSVTLSAAAYAHFEAAAKREHRTLPNYLFVKLEQVFEAESRVPASTEAPASAV